MKSKGELTKEKILTEATRLVRRKGFDGTSISDVTAATGMKKGCLYFHFSGKEDLSLAILEKAKADFFSSLDTYLEGVRRPERLDHLFRYVLKLISDDGVDTGCIFGNTATEMSGKNQRLSEFVREVFVEWIERISRIVKDAQDAGRIRKDLSSAILAQHIIMSLEGGIMLARLGKSEKPVKDCITSLKALLGMNK